MVDEQAYVTDPEGIAYARAINQHLPSDVRVLCVQVRPKLLQQYCVV